MAATKYTYSISSDFPNAKVDLSRLTLEIQQSSIVTALDYINTDGDDCNVWFKAELSTEDQTTLDTIVANHSGEPLEETPQPVEMKYKDNGGVWRAPAFQRDKPLMTASPATEGWATFFTGAGDNKNPTPPDTGRGTGTPLRIVFTDAGNEYVEAEFIEPIELHDGQIFYKPADNWNAEDVFSVSIYMPATSVTPNGTSTGNCNLYPQTGFNLIVPAAGDGAYDVDLNDAVPVPTDAKDGFWDTDKLTGEITASPTPGQAKWHLMDVAVEAFYARNINMGNPIGTFDIDAYKAEWVSDRWKLRLRCIRATAGAGTISGWLMCFRENVR